MQKVIKRQTFNSFFTGHIMSRLHIIMSSLLQEILKSGLKFFHRDVKYQRRIMQSSELQIRLLKCRDLLLGLKGVHYFSTWMSFMFFF